MDRSYLLARILFEELIFTNSLSHDKIVSTINTSHKNLAEILSGHQVLQIGELLAVLKMVEKSSCNFFTSYDKLESTLKSRGLDAIEELYKKFKSERIDWYCICGTAYKLDGFCRFINDSDLSKPRGGVKITD